MFDDLVGAWLLVWTIRLSVVCYLIRIAIGMRGGLIGCIPSTAVCVCWAAGCALYVSHVICAFEYSHDWSHAAAVEHTALETDRVVGVRRGEGVWVNYAFTLIWIADVFRLIYLNHNSSSTEARTDRLIHITFAFIFFNATVVFGPEIYRLAMVPVLVGLLCIRYLSKRKTAAS